MSYCRFVVSDLYVFLHCDGHLTCCGCKLQGNFDAHRTCDMVAHVKEHIAAGHNVPSDLISKLRADQKGNDVWMKKRRRAGVRAT